MGVWKSKIWTNKKKKKTGRFRNRVGNYPSVDKIKLTPTSELIHWIRPRMNDVHNLPHVGMRFPRPNNNLVCKGNCCLYSNNLCHVNKKKTVDYYKLWSPWFCILHISMEIFCLSFNVRGQKLLIFLFKLIWNLHVVKISKWKISG